MSFSLKSVSYSYVSKSEVATPDAPYKGIEVNNLDFPSEGLTAVIGPSGSGKTTLLSVLAGFISPEIGIDGFFAINGDAVGNSGHPAGRVSFVFQSPFLLGSGSGLLNIMQGYVGSQRPDRDGLSTAEVRKTLAELGMDDESKQLLAKNASDLSGGEAQRVSIMRALLTNPDVILCDEPTSSLDETNANRALRALQSWSQSNKKPVIWITHNIEQAARYADNFVFVSAGRIYETSEIEVDLLANEPRPIDGANDAAVSDRVALLRDISSKLLLGTGPDAKDGASTDSAAQPDDSIELSRMEYARWISNALSTDSLVFNTIVKNNPMALAPKPAQSLLGKIYRTAPAPTGSLWRNFWCVVKYSRLSLGIILLVLLLQVSGAFVLGKVADIYSEQRLQDPAVARIVFEHVIGQNTIGQTGEAEVLYAGAAMDQMEQLLFDKIAQTTPDADLTRVALFGRRTIAQSQIKLAPVFTNCAGWQPVETIALDVADPLVAQTVLQSTGMPHVGGAMTQDTGAFISRASAAFASGRMDAVAVLDEALVGLLRDRCGVPAGDPLVVDWAVGSAGTLEPIKLEIVGAISGPPPLYPSAMQMLVFEHDFQGAINLQDGGNPDPFRIATAYFPIEGFEAALDVVHDRGYRVRDDSSAAVQTLLQVSKAAVIVPSILIIINYLACIILVILVVDSLMELNKRVLAIFVAHGFRLRDMITVTLLHLLPAAIFAAIGMAAVFLTVVGLWSNALPVTQAEMSGIQFSALTSSIGTVLVVLLGAALFVIIRWWALIRQNLKTALQE